MSILLVDDRPENLVALSAILSATEYELVTANSGAEALRKVLKHDFALILLDVLMPEMDGFEVATLIKQRDPSKHVPIIFLTAVGTDVSFIYKGYSAGAVDYLCKPIDPDVVKAKVAVFVDLYRKNQQIKRQSELLHEAERRERAIQLAELQLANKKRYQNLADAIPQIVWTARTDGAIDSLNQRWTEYTGIEIADAESWGWLEALHPDDRASCGERWRKSVRTGAGFQFECRLRRGSDGAYCWHLCRGVPEHNKSGGIVAWLGTFTDIDEQRRTLSALDQFKETLDAVRDGVWIFEPHSLQFTYVNEGATRHLHYSREELLAMSPIHVMPQFDPQSFRDLLRPLLEGQRDALAIETVSRSRDGAEHPVDLSLQYICPPGESGRFVSIVRDVTERKRAEQERARLFAEAQAAVRARDEFLSIASHELKTPLTALQLQVKSLIRAGANGNVPAPEKVAAKLPAIDRQVYRLTKLIDNLLDISRITAGRIDLEIDDVDLATVVRESAERLREEATRAGCTMSLEIDGTVTGRWDALRLDQVVTNILTNALKYGAGKPIDVRVECSDQQARFVVRDHGIGIAPEDQARIFQRFERAVSERQYGGFGLGLWIVRQIVNALGGEIAVASEPGAGSTFTVELPRSAEARKSDVELKASVPPTRAVSQQAAEGN